jgi:urease accessory protein
VKVDEALGLGVRAERAASAFAGWEARLALEIGRDASGTSRLRRSLHEGPLRVQRAFHPEGPGGPCHLYVLHPPGGIVDGDSLELTVDIGPGARALLTTPGAAKLYRARHPSPDAAQRDRVRLKQTIRVQSEAVSEWLPQETIAFSGAEANIATRIELARDATFAGWEIFCLGRPASGESFDRGALRTSLEIVRDGELQYVERGRYRGGDPMLDAAWGLGGAPVFGLFVISCPRIEASWVEALRAQVLAAPGTFAATLVSGLLLVRTVCASTREARSLFERAFAVLRPRYAGLPVVPPRIWST